MSGLERALYVSRAVLPTAVEQVRALVGGAQVFNRRHDVTGALVFTGERFAQVVEARGDVLDELLARIGRDRRHDGMRIVWRGPVERRLYPRWAMACVHSPDAESLIDELSRSDDLGTGAAHDAMRQLFAEEALGPGHHV